MCRDIKSLKIQGAMSVAIAGIKAMPMKGFNLKAILSLRPTEPALRNGIEYAKRYGEKKALSYYNKTQKKINKYGYKKIRGIIFTHCHSSSVINLLIYAKKKGQKFRVYNTETRPLYQGRKTAKELSKAGINVTIISDLSAGDALTKGGRIEKADLAVMGADAVLKDGSVINKIGSGMFAELAYRHKIPIYIVTQGWKFSKRNVKIEERAFSEIWKNAPKYVKLRNPAFEKVNNKFITGIISEFGILKPKKFVKRVRKEYKWI